MEHRLELVLKRIEERRERVLLGRVSTAVWAVHAVLALLLFCARSQVGGALLLLTGLVAVSAFATNAIARRVVRARSKGPMSTARFVEREHGSLDSAVLTAAELKPELEPEPSGKPRYGFLARRLIDEVLERSRRESWTKLVPDARIKSAWLGHAGAATLFLLALALLAGSPFVPALAPVVGPRTSSPASADFDVLVLPGNTEVESGRSVLITAEFNARPEDLPSDAELVLSPENGEDRRLPLSRSIDDAVFALRLAEVLEGLSYRIEWSGGTTGSYTLDVFELPALRRADVHLAYPAYTGLPDRVVEDTRRVTVPAGTEVTFHCLLNKEVVSAVLLPESETASALPLAAHPATEHMYTAGFTAAETTRFELVLEDAEGRTSDGAARLTVRVTKNLPPELLVRAQDVRVSPLEELTLAAELSDDFGLQRYGIAYRLGGAEPHEIELGRDTQRGESIEVSHTIALEELEAQPRQLLSFHFWAEDLDQDGAPRRSASDLFFAEVRPFEEIFREAPPQEAGGGGEQGQGEAGEQQGGDTAELTQLQRDVILATWNLIRRGLDDEQALDEAIETVLEAEDEVRTGLEARAQEEPSETVTKAAEAVGRSLRELERARSETSLEPLESALVPEQEAYQYLLELQDQEFAVSRAGQPSPGSARGAASQGPSQAQLNQLELESSENRYESESQASRAESEADADRETRQALSRLKELARRQDDLNERLRELRSELEATETEEERDALQRRLERLQEAQQEILRDTDELLERMQSSEARQDLAPQAEQLEETRENVQRASDALQRGELAEAQTEGSRAQRELESLEDELRDASSGRFEERMRALRNEAQRLERRQEELDGELQGDGQASPRSLSDDVPAQEAERERVARDLEQQSDDLEALLEQVEETIGEAEDTEPFLAEELFETLDDARRDRVEQALDETREMVERGLPREARQIGELALDGLRNVRAGVDRAAEGVLGSGVEALERAREELDQLREELEGEIDRERPEPGEGQPGEGQPGEGQPGEGQPGEGQPGEGQPGEGQPGEGQPGEGQPGEGQPGEGQPGEGQQGQPQRGAEGRPSLADGPRPSAPNELGAESAGGRGRGGGQVAPLTGGDFLDWSDRLRDVEEMVDDPELSAEAARIREQARMTREDFKRHSREPNWDLVEDKILDPLAELGRLVEEEVRRLKADDPLVPIDRDPVPPEFAEDVRRYYENLGRSR